MKDGVMKFNYDNVVFRVIAKIADAFYISILWLIFCLPVVTAGASTSAMYYVVHNQFRGGRGYIWKSFWKTFKEDFKSSLLCTLAVICLFAIVRFDVVFLNSLAAANPDVSVIGALHVIFYYLQFFVLAWGIFVFCYRGRFSDGAKRSLKNGGMLFFNCFLWALGLIVLLVVAVTIVRDMPFFILVIPCLIMLYLDFALENTFRRVMSPEDREMEKERDYTKDF